MQKTNIKEYTRKIAVLAIMTALAAVCSSSFPFGLTIRVGDFIKVSPVFIIVALVAARYGWCEAAIVAFLSDLIQSLTAGLGVSPLILLINTLSGICFGIFLKNYCGKTKPIVFSVLITQIIGSMILTTAVLCIRYGVPIFPTIYFRALQTVIMIVVEISLLILILKKLKLHKKL